MRPDEARQKFNLADQLYREKKYPDALKVLDELDADFPNAKNVMYPKAMCLAKLGRVNEAHTICQKLKALYNDPRADELMHKLGASVPPPVPPATNVPGVDLTFNPLDLSNIGPVPGAPGGDPMGLGDLFAPKPAAPVSPQLQGPNRKPLYIGLGVAGGVLLIGLLCLPLFMKGSGTQETGTQQQAEAETAAAPPIYWYNSYETGTNASWDKNAPTLLFFYSSSSDDATRMMTEVWNEPSIAHLVKGWTCIRIDIEADPETASYYEVEKTPATFVEDSWGELVYEQSGFLTAQDFYSAIQPLNLQVMEMPTVGAGQVILIILVVILQASGTLYLTLLILRKLPNDEFLKDILSATLVGVPISLMLGGCSCVGVIAAYFILKNLYEFEFVDYLAYLAVSIIVGLFTSVLIAAILGLPFDTFLELVKNQ